MAMPTLPEDVLEIIFDTIHDKTAPPTPSSHTTFRSLCLVSKTFLPLARTRLYYRPFQPTRAMLYQKGLRLIKGLQMNPALGLLIRSLEGISSACIPSFVSLLNLSLLLLAFDLDLSIVGSTIPQILVALESLVGVKKLSIKCPHSSLYGWRSITLKILSLPAFASLEGLRIETGAALKAPIPSLPLALQLKCLVIDSSFDTFRAIAPVLSAIMTTLESLALNKVQFTSTEMYDLLESLAPTTSSLSLSAGVRRSRIFASTYRNNHSLPHIPCHPFTSLPHLTTLALHHTQGPSLSFLKVLASSCLELVELDLSGSLWTSDTSLPAHLTPEEHFNLVFPRQAILSALQSISKLKKINLGHLMHSHDAERYSMIKEGLGGQGVAVKWELCVNDGHRVAIDSYSDSADDLLWRI